MNRQSQKKFFILFQKFSEFCNMFWPTWPS